MRRFETIVTASAIVTTRSGHDLRCALGACGHSLAQKSVASAAGISTTCEPHMPKSRLLPTEEVSEAGEKTLDEPGTDAGAKRTKSGSFL